MLSTSTEANLSMNIVIVFTNVYMPVINNPMDVYSARLYFFPKNSLSIKAIEKTRKKQNVVDVF